MSITDELMEYAQSWRETPNLMDDLDAGDIDGLLGDIEHIADRIDAEHEEAVREAYAKGREDGIGVAKTMTERMVELPKDADRVPIHVGDVLTDDAEFKSEGVVECLMLDESGWMVGFGKGWTDVRIHEWHHYHAPTVEDVLREFANECLTYATCVDDHEVADAIELYAAKLRLAEGEDA